jgi:hypothetical protein
MLKIKLIKSPNYYLLSSLWQLVLNNLQYEDVILFYEYFSCKKPERPIYLYSSLFFETNIENFYVPSGQIITKEGIQNAVYFMVANNIKLWIECEQCNKYNELSIVGYSDISEQYQYKIMVYIARGHYYYSHCECRGECLRESFRSVRVLERTGGIQQLKLALTNGISYI